LLVNYNKYEYLNPEAFFNEKCWCNLVLIRVLNFRLAVPVLAGLFYRTKVYDGISLKLSRLKYRLCKSVFCAYQDIGVDISECIGKRCTRQPAPTVGTNVKSPSSRMEADQSIAESAMQNEDHHADIRLISLI